MNNCYVYKWVELTTLKWYIGSRTAKGCHVDDGYLCSSKIVKPLILANPSNWRREIIETGTRIEILALEHEILDCLDAAKDPRSYNRCNGGGTFCGGVHSEETKAKMRGKRSGVTRRPLSDEHKAKLSVANKGHIKSKDHKAKLTEAWLTRAPMTPETKAKMCKPKSAETITKRQATKRAKLEANKEDQEC
jgi:hypothetical protein